MIKLNFTQGLWTYQIRRHVIRITSTYLQCHTLAAGEIPSIATVWTHRRDQKIKFYEGDAECEANARLISSSPEMLQALIEAHIALGYCSDYDIPLCTHDNVKKAIEKATGMKIEEILKIYEDQNEHTTA